MQRSHLPLLGLRAFEATARHLSVSKAAMELCVTPGAISQQVKLLEETIGVALIQRSGRAIELTDAGLLLQPQLTQALDWISVALDSVTRKRNKSTIKLTLLPTLAEKWLMPRLAGFHGAHPELDIQIMTSFRSVELEEEDVSFAMCRLLSTGEVRAYDTSSTGSTDISSSNPRGNTDGEDD